MPFKHSLSLKMIGFAVGVTLFASVGAQAETLCLSVKDGLDKMCARDRSADSSCPNGGGEKTFAWIEDSCVNPTGREVIREIVSLADGATIPKAVFREHTPDEIAISLNYRYFQKKVRPQIKREDVESPGYDIYRNVFPMMAFNVRYIKSLISYGFLNQHQLTHTKGYDGHEYRAQVEDALIGVKIEAEYGDDVRRPENYLRPKYSYASFYEPADSVQPGYATQYGGVLAVFDDSIKKRAFFTSGDSLDHYGDGPLEAMTYYNLYRSFSLQKTSDYYESQIWGRLDFSHVRYLLVDCPEFESTKDDVIQALKDIGSQLPVFTCRQETGPDSFTRLVPDKQIYGASLTDLNIPELKGPAKIKIVEATFGGNIHGIAGGNATAKAAAYCDGKPTCHYRVSVRHLGEPAPHKAKSFSISWTCSDNLDQAPHQLNIPANAVGKSLTLSCLPGAAQDDSGDGT